MFRRVARLKAIAVATPFNSPLIRTMSPDSIAMSVPVPIAIPTSAWASAGASLIPSPTIATTFPSPWILRTSSAFWSGRTSARTRALPAPSAIPFPPPPFSPRHAPGALSVPGHEDPRASPLRQFLRGGKEKGRVDPFLLEPPFAAHVDAPSRNRGADPVARPGVKLPGRFQGKPPFFLAPHHHVRQGVLRPGLGGGGEPEQVPLPFLPLEGAAGCQPDAGKLRPPAGDRPGLGVRDGVRLVRRLQRGPAPDQ